MLNVNLKKTHTHTHIHCCECIEGCCELKTSVLSHSCNLQSSIMEGLMLKQMYSSARKCFYCQLHNNVFSI